MRLALPPGARSVPKPDSPLSAALLLISIHTYSEVSNMNQNILSAKLQAIMDNAVAQNEVAGVNLLVLQNGKELLYAQSGYADLEAKHPLQKDTIFRLYSMSKPITAAAAMILMERGIIDLCDPVKKFLPGFQNQKVAKGDELVPVRRDCTIRDLLSMTSGLLYGGTDKAGKAAEAVIEEAKARMDGPDALSTVELANRLGSQPLFFHPGEHFNYGTSADILGAVIEVASGMRFGEFLRKEIFEPLQMNDEIGRALQQGLIVRDVEDGYGAGQQEAFQPFQCRHIQIIGRFIQQQCVRLRQ